MGCMDNSMSLKRQSSILSPSTLPSSESPTVYTFSSLAHQDGLSYSSGVFHIVSSFLTFCYFILLIPFRFTSEYIGCDKVYKLHRNKYQTILSSLAIFCTIVYSIVNTRYCFRENIQKKPSKVFKNANIVLNVAYQLTWYFTFWIRKEEFGKLLSVCHSEQRSSKSKPTVTIRIILFLIIIFNLLKLCWEWGYDFLSEGIEKGLRYRAESGLYMFYLSDNDTMDPDDTISDELAIFSWFHLIIEMYFYHHLYLVELFPLMSAIMIHYTTTEFINKIQSLNDKQESNRQTTDIADEIMKVYNGFKEVAKCVNRIAGPITVVFLLMMTPTWVWSVFGIFNIENWTYAIYYVCKLVLYTAQLLIAAGAYSKAVYFQDWLFHRRTQHMANSYVLLEGAFQQEAKVLDYIYADDPMRFAGLKGGQFFTITYSFIGTMASVVITYAVVMLQFQIN